MNFDKKRLAGTLLSMGALQWFFSVMIAEGLHQGFNLSPNQWIPFSNQIHYVSELGLGSTAPIFNISTMMLGLMITGASCMLYLKDRAKLFSALLFIAGVGAFGVGVFPANMQPAHGIFQLLALWFGAFSAVSSSRRQQAPASYISAALGIVSFVTSIVFYPYLGLGVNDMSTFLGLGKGAMERVVIYSLILWIFGYGYHIAVRTSENQSLSDRTLPYQPETADAEMLQPNRRLTNPHCRAEQRNRVLAREGPRFRLLWLLSR